MTYQIPRIDWVLGCNLPEYILNCRPVVLGRACNSCNVHVIMCTLHCIVERVRRTNVGRYVHFICCARFLYADDNVLLAPSVTGLQLSLTTCERYLSEIGMNINVSKSTCIRFGARFSNVC
jgi:hypothetical protein